MASNPDKNGRQIGLGDIIRVVPIGYTYPVVGFAGAFSGDGVYDSGSVTFVDPNSQVQTTASFNDGDAEVLLKNGTTTAPGN